MANHKRPIDARLAIAANRNSVGELPRRISVLQTDSALRLQRPTKLDAVDLARFFLWLVGNSRRPTQTTLSLLSSLLMFLHVRHHPLEQFRVAAPVVDVIRNRECLMVHGEEFVSEPSVAW